SSFMLAHVSLMLAYLVHSLNLPPSYIPSSLSFFNDSATTEIYTLSLHDALPICCRAYPLQWPCLRDRRCHSCSPKGHGHPDRRPDRKSTRLNSSHVKISYAVFCLKKKNKKNYTYHQHTTSTT